MQFLLHYNNLKTKIGNRYLQMPIPTSRCHNEVILPTCRHFGLYIVTFWNKDIGMRFFLDIHKFRNQSDDFLMPKRRHFADMSAFLLIYSNSLKYSYWHAFFLNSHKFKTDIQMLYGRINLTTSWCQYDAIIPTWRYFG